METGDNQKKMIFDNSNTHEWQKMIQKIIAQLGV